MVGRQEAQIERARAARERRQEATRIIRERLGIDMSMSALVSLAKQVIGEERVRCVELWVRRERLTRRVDGFGALAALVDATNVLGPAWWSRAHHRFDTPGEWLDGPAPDQVLSSFETKDGSLHWPTPLISLEWWASDDVADQVWGTPSGFVDLNSQQPSDRFALPSTARVGQRLVLSFDPGSRIDAEVVARDGGALGSELISDSIRQSSPSEVAWAWVVGSSIGPHRFADEVPGTDQDPYSSVVDQATAEAIRSWALHSNFDEADVGRAWPRVLDVINACDVGRNGPAWVTRRGSSRER